MINTKILKRISYPTEYQADQTHKEGLSNQIEDQTWPCQLQNQPSEPRKHPYQPEIVHVYVNEYDITGSFILGQKRAMRKTAVIGGHRKFETACI